MTKCKCNKCDCETVHDCSINNCKCCNEHTQREQPISVGA